MVRRSTPSFANNLARMGRIMAQLGHAQDSTTSETRNAVRKYLHQSPNPLRVEDICEATGLHHNTIRPHLDTLLAAGEIRREHEDSPKRGRPYWLYSTTDSDALAELAEELDAQLAVANPDRVVRKLAKEWIANGESVAKVETIDEAVDQAVEILNTLGFEADRNVVGDEITLRSCPYVELAGEQPIICDIHGEMLNEVLRRSGCDVSLTQLDVFPKPGVCVARLKRSDLDPARVVRMNRMKK